MRSFAASIVMTVLAHGVLAPAPAVPQRDRPTPPAGTARIRGRVVAADTRTPLRRALVRLASHEAHLNRTVSTDAEGRFDVTGLPAGSYFLTVTRNGYASLQFGQQRPFEPGRPLELASGQVMEHVDFALPRGGVISGRVTDVLGEPVPGVHMLAMRYRYMSTGDRQLVPDSGGSFNRVTNDLGEFRVSGLMPGTYVLSANPDNGAMRGIPDSGENDAYVTTFYPGTLSAEQAEPIAVGMADVATVTFALSTARLTRVSGTIRSSQGRPLGGSRLWLRSRTPTGGWSRTGPSIGADGRFSITSVAPGDYSLDVGPRFGSPGPTGGRESEEVASVPFTAAGRDITDLTITTTAGATLTGRVTFEGTSKAARPERVAAEEPDHSVGLVYRYDSDNGAIDAAGRFQLRGIIGRVILRTNYTNPDAAGAAWIVKSVTLNGADITDTPLDIPGGGEFSGIEITLTDTLTVLSGTATNARREAVKDYVVVVLPERLKEGALPERFTRTARPNQEGRYEIRGLPAGDYVAVAIAALEDGNEWDPAFRKQVAPTAKRFRLNHGQNATLDLQLMQ